MSGSGRSHSWPVPYSRALEGEYKPGQTVFVKGFVLGERFDINLTFGPKSDTDDIALHVSCRFDEKKIVLNTRKDGEWGKEERHGLSGLKQNEEFEIRIRAHDDYFEMFVCGKECAKYDYRAPLNLINTVLVDGAVELYRVSWEGRYYEMPFEVAMPAGLAPGKAIYIAGVVDKRADRFWVNLKAGDDVIVQVNPRFDEKCVVRNTRVNGEWGVEERDGKFTLHKDRTFDLIIGCTEGGYEIFMDGEPFCTYAHRLDHAKVDKLTIEGDIELQGVHW